MSSDRQRVAADPDGSTPEVERARFERLFHDYAPRVRGYFLRRGVDGSGAEELVQEVMLTLWRKAEHYDPERAPLSTWVFTIARNKHIDAYRRQRRPEPDPSDPCFARGQVERAQWPDAQAGAERRRAALKGVLQTLAPEQRETLVLLYLRGLTSAQVAERQKVPLGTVKSRARRALEALRARLEEDPGAA